MLSKNLAAEIYTQIKLELYSGYLIYPWPPILNQKPARICQLDEKTGKEEQEHALKFYDYSMIEASG
jgi:ferritin